jgi:hypothetical protein
MLFAPSILLAQKIDVVQYDSLLFQLNQVSDFNKSLEIEEIQGVYRLSVWHFVPNLNYDFINNNYYLTISTSNFISNMISRRQEKRKISAIERRYENKKKFEEIHLKSLLLSVNQKFDNLKASGIILSNDIELYQIKEQEYNNNEMDLESFLREKSSILNKIKTHNALIPEIQTALFEIEKLTEMPVTFDLQPFYVSFDKILLP